MVFYPRSHKKSQHIIYYKITHHPNNCNSFILFFIILLVIIIIVTCRKTPFISRCLSSYDKENENANNNVNLLKSSFDEDDAELYSTCKPLPVSTPSIHPFDSVVINTKQEPIEKLKTSFLKHATLSKTNHGKIKKLTEDATNTIETQDEVSQHGLAPGTIMDKCTTCTCMWVCDGGCVISKNGTSCITISA